MRTCEAYFSFQLSFKIIMSLYRRHKMTYSCCEVSFFQTELNRLFVFLWREVSQRDLSMAALDSS